MKIEANLLEDVVMVDLTNHEDEGITYSDQKGRIRKPQGIVSRKKQAAIQRNSSLIEVKLQCFKCKKHGHYASKFPQGDQEK